MRIAWVAPVALRGSKRDHMKPVLPAENSFF
jgi:hypothetical protein